MRKIFVIFSLIFITSQVNAIVSQDSVYYSLFKFLKQDSIINQVMQEQHAITKERNWFEFAQHFIRVEKALYPYKEGIDMNERVGVYTFGYTGLSDMYHVLIKVGDKYYVYNCNDLNRILDKLIYINSFNPKDLPSELIIEYIKSLKESLSYIAWAEVLHVMTKIGVIYDCTK